MASFRRTLSPVQHDRSPYRNGSSMSPLSLGSPAQKFQSNSKPSVSLSVYFVALQRFVAGALPLKQFRRSQQSWRRSIFSRCVLFFIFGLLLGLMPFRQVDEIRSHDFLFEIKSQEELQSKSEISVSRSRDGEIGMVSLSDSGIKERFDYRPRDLLIVVTPTYNRAFQAYYLNRLGQVLGLVNPPVLWIVVEMDAQSLETAEILRKTDVMYRHLVCTKNMTDIKDRGVQQRNTAIEHIERHKLDGIVYFADDDNMYSLELFESIREIRPREFVWLIDPQVHFDHQVHIVRDLYNSIARTKHGLLLQFLHGFVLILDLFSRFGTWPVAMLAQSKNKATLEGPVCNEGQVIGWYTNEKSKRLRRFHADMSGFAFNSTILWDPRRWKRPYLDPIRQLDTVREGFQETTFIEQLVADESQMEGVPGGCDRILNWHLHLDAHGFGYPSGWFLENNLVAIEPLDR